MTANIEFCDGEYMISGILNFLSVMPLWNQSLALFQNEKNIQINLEKVSECNGAGLSLLVEWKRYASLHQKIISFKSVPETLWSIAKISGVSELLK
ncbi:MAG TPA: STAS domain-containing protein [Gammaproteobacteria bacterium]|jgi:ABC-type transporter Mla MlaB component|nr:STAS domain-containing protein [Gammaproteobacteria bacterium]